MNKNEGRVFVYAGHVHAEAVECEECKAWILKAEREHHTCDPDDWYAELAARMKDMAPA